jgi:hypothetical protein
LDALRMPNRAKAQQAQIETRPDDDPIHCLLQDERALSSPS